jgi:hypothetical protein
MNNPDPEVGADGINNGNDLGFVNNWVLYMMNLISYFLMITHVVSLIFNGEIPIIYFIGFGTIVVLYNNLRVIKFNEAEELSYKDLCVRFFVGVIASLSPEWEFKRNTPREEQPANENNALGNLANNEP